MVLASTRLCGICRFYFYPCKDWNRGGWLQSCHCNPHDGSGSFCLGNGVFTHQQAGFRAISQKSWIFLILSGLATGASWLCYYKALQIGDASKVVPVDKLSVVITLILAFVFLHEKFTVKSGIGCLLIGVGTLLMVL